MSFLTQSEYDRIDTIPIALPQTELRRQSYIQIAAIELDLGQKLEMRSLHLHLFKILTPGVTPQLTTTSLGLASTGLMSGLMTSSAIGLVNIFSPGASCMSAEQPVIVTAPGIYKVYVFNNSYNVDLAVVVTGSVRRYMP